MVLETDGLPAEELINFFLAEHFENFNEDIPHKYNKQALFFNSILISCSVTRTAEHTIRRHHQGICF